MSKLFKKLPDSVRKSVRIEVRMSEIDAQSIRHSASLRSLAVAEFMLRAALSRRAEVQYDNEIVLEIRSVVQVIRQLHADLITRNIHPPIDLLGLLVDAGLEAMQRIDK